MLSIAEIALLKLDPVGAFSLWGEARSGFEPHVIRACYSHPKRPRVSSWVFGSRVLAMVNHEKKRALVCFGRDVKTDREKSDCPPFLVFEALATGIYHEVFKNRGFHPASLRFSDYPLFAKNKKEAPVAWGLRSPFGTPLSTTPSGAWRLVDLEYRDNRYVFPESGVSMRRQYVVPRMIDELSDTTSEREINLSSYVDRVQPTIMFA